MRRRRRDERGATAVEAALVTPLLVLLVFGMIEMAFLLRDYAVVTSNTRTGARVAATGAAAGPAVDCTGDTTAPCSPNTVPALAQMAADAIQRSGSAMPAENIDRIAVYQANDRGLPGTATQMATTDDLCQGAANCVTYTWRPDPAPATTGRFRYTSGTWPSAQISACFPGTAAAPLHRVGVAMQATHPMTTGLFGDGITLRQYTTMNFEPLPTQSCKANQHQ
ncbi:TadE/TadG family type IV pilus assembly protein [Nocardioides sp. GXQ0305]|uniref:TadE/TadG family type IV pilus assembly protein n=1 Tax=Nocardioides sp. GXQ0305 TaxID=3423912 RepID=UPI003D7D11DB